MPGKSPYSVAHNHVRRTERVLDDGTHEYHYTIHCFGSCRFGEGLGFATFHSGVEWWVDHAIDKHRDEAVFGVVTVEDYDH